MSGEPTRKEFIMAKLTGVTLSQVKGNGNAGELKAKIARNVVAIVGEKGVVLVSNNGDYQAMYQNDSVVDACLEGLVDLLESIPDNTEELLAKPYRVILPKVIGGLATGSFIDWIRTGKAVTSGEDMPKERLETYAHVMKLMSTRYANVELVADRFASKQDREVIDPVWKALKAEIANAIRGNSAILNGTTSASKAPEMSAEDKAKIAQLRAEIEELEDLLDDTDDEVEEAKLQKKIDKKMSRIARIKAMNGTEEKAVESTETAEPQVADELKGLF